MMKMIRVLIFVLITLMVYSQNTFAESPRRTVKKGITEYNQEQYDRALAEFMAARQNAKDSPEIPFNLGTTLYKLENYPEAIREFGQVLQHDDPRIASQAWYNLGNALAGVEKYPEAIDAYKNSLRVNHKNEDAKHNLEMLMRLMEMPPPEQQQQQNGEEDESQQKQEQEQAQQSEPKDDDGDDESSQDFESSENDEEMPPQSEFEQTSDMSEEEALQLLQAMEQDDREALEDMLKRKFSDSPRVDKDW